MQKLSQKWMKCSLKWKITAIIACIAIIVVVSQSVTIVVTYAAMLDFEEFMHDNSIYYNLQTVIKEEKEKFLVYMRNRTDENKLAFEAACEASEDCIKALDFDYEQMGGERYARIWNIINGYQGYKGYREAIVLKSEQDIGYIEELYEVLDMQEHLSTYASRLVQVTMEEGDLIYKERIASLENMPFFIAGVAIVMAIAWAGIRHVVAITLVKPLMLIIEDSRKIAVNDFTSPELQISNQDEIGELVQAFNKMKRAMKKYIATLKEKNRIAELLHKEEMEKIKLEKHIESTRLELLKHQVNPHFLFNTLNMISGMARLEDAEVTGKMIISLGNLFRYNLRTVEQEVYLEQEMEVLEDYIYIQQMRFDNRIVYQKSIEADETQVKIPAFTLQPIVENAFAHGLVMKEEAGSIELKVWKENNMLIVTIADNGEGIDEEELKALNERIHMENNTGKGIGLGSICRRVDILYPDGKFHVYSEKGKGTTVRLEIPQKIEERGKADV
uniref:sensor histidine kinase n=1 Tax=Agathobacter sp. TaxID=2021311 RepID=UPI004056381B